MISDDRLAEVWRAYENNGQNELERWIKDTHDDELAALIERFPKDKTTFVVDWQHLWRFSPDESPFENQKLAEVVISKHHDIRKLFEWVVEDAVESIGHSLNFEDNEFQVRFNRVRQPKDVTKTIKGDDVNELSTIRGQVSKASATKPRVTEAALVCRSCHTTNYVPQPAHGTHIPDTCKGADCNASTFDLDYSESTTVHHQLVRIKEPPESDGEDNHVDAHLTHDQAGIVNAGERVDISGILQLFGGWRRPHGDGRYARGDMHIALIGDPATGKSSLLNAAESLSPRSTFVSGKNASKAGMTAAAVRDDFGETEWSLEAGAIVKAHKGVACVDEIDKVNPEVVSSLHTALEKQRLEVSKAGINATMKCETSLLAAGNPADGRFHDEVERIQQIDMAPALRSRFDLIYCLTDVVERERDIELAKHQTRIRAESGRAARKNQKTDREESVPIDTDLMRAYIAYAREHSHPIVESPEVEERIAETYADLRESDAGIAGLNARLVDAMNRISEASARVRLDDTVRMEDVERAESIINQYLQDIEVLDEHGDLNVEIADMMETGSSVDDRMEAKDIPGIIRTLQPDETSFVDVETVIQTADEAGYPKENTLGRIKNLADNGQAIFDERDNEVRML